MKKTRSLFLALLIVMLLMQLSACGSPAPAEETPEASPRETEAAEPERTPEETEKEIKELLNQAWSYAYPDSGEPDYAAARPLFEQAAELGSADALNELGLLYNDGKGVEQDYEKARTYYEQAAELGNMYALFNLAWMYENGQGVAVDMTKAVDYYEQAGELGNTDALFNLGWMYENGQGVPQDMSMALAWYEMAAKRGNAAAAYQAAEICRFGDGVEIDTAKAVGFLELAADLDHSDALFALGYLYAYGEGVEQDYAKAKEYYERAAALGSYMAMNNLGVMYENARGVEKNLEMARYWYERADAQKCIGTLLDRGWEIEPADSAEWMLHDVAEFLCGAADGGSGKAIVDLSVLERFNNTGYLDKERVETWAGTARQRGDGEALYGIGRLFYYRNGLSRDPDAALAYFREAEALGSTQAMCEIGNMLEHDHPDQALEWYLKAADAGDPDGLHRTAFYYDFRSQEETALEWYLKTIEAGGMDDKIPYQIGGCYRDLKQYDKAMEWYLRGVTDYNDGDCMYEISQLYENGLGVEKDHAAAADWLARAKEVGYIHFS